MVKFKNMIKVNICNGRLNLSKRFVSLFLAGATIFSLSGCSIGNDKNDTEISKVYVTALSDNSSDEQEFEYVNGVCFEMINNDGELIEQWYSEDGMRLIADVSDGEYIVRVNSVPEGYSVLNTEEVSIVIGEDKLFNLEFYFTQNLEYFKEEERQNNIINSFKSRVLTKDDED